MTDVVDRLMAKRLGVLPDWAEALMTEAANEILAWRNELSAVRIGLKIAQMNGLQ